MAFNVCIRSSAQIKELTKELFNFLRWYFIIYFENTCFDLQQEIRKYAEK